MYQLITHIHLQSWVYFVVKKDHNSLPKCCIFSSFLISLGNLTYNWIPIFAVLFLKALILQNWMCRATLWCILWFWISVFCSKLPVFIVIEHTISIMYMQGTKSMFWALKCYLHVLYLPTLLINHINLVCSLKIFLLSGSPPQDIKTYLKQSWQKAKSILLINC